MGLYHEQPLPLPLHRRHERTSQAGSYLLHLSQLELLSPRYETDFDSKAPKFDGRTGEFSISGYQLTILGKVLLGHIGFTHKNLESLRF